MRGYFWWEIYHAMQKNKDIWVISSDLGYRMWDKVRDDFPDRFVNCGASEQAATGIAVGLALEGKIPFLYSITPFLLYRPFETIKNYIDKEQIPVKLIGSGRDKDYLEDGPSHWAEEDKLLFEDKNASPVPYTIPRVFKNIEALWPEKKEQIPDLVKEMIETDKPYYVNLKR